MKVFLHQVLLCLQPWVSPKKATGGSTGHAPLALGWHQALKCPSSGAVRLCFMRSPAPLPHKHCHYPAGVLERSKSALAWGHWLPAGIRAPGAWMRTLMQWSDMDSQLPFSLESLDSHITPASFCKLPKLGIGQRSCQGYKK